MSGTVIVKDYILRDTIITGSPGGSEPRKGERARTIEPRNTQLPHSGAISLLDYIYFINIPSNKYLSAPVVHLITYTVMITMRAGLLPGTKPCLGQSGFLLPGKPHQLAPPINNYYR